MLEGVEYNRIPGRLATGNRAFILKCAELYSNHYGIWGKKGVRPNKNIRLSAHKICEWLQSDDVTIYYAMRKEMLVGYAIAFSRNENNYGVVTWVTQLVVHKDYRHNGIAKNFVFHLGIIESLCMGDCKCESICSACVRKGYTQEGETCKDTEKLD